MKTRKALKRSWRQGSDETSPYTAGEKDYTALVSKMKDAGIEAVYLGGLTTPKAALILRQMRETGPAGSNALW